MWSPFCLSLVLSGDADPKERTRRARFHHRLLRNMLSVFLTPCESDAKSHGVDICHSRPRVTCYRVNTALAFSFAGPLSNAKRCFHISHYIGLHRLAHCALTHNWHTNRRRRTQVTAPWKKNKSTSHSTVIGKDTLCAIQQQVHKQSGDSVRTRKISTSKRKGFSMRTKRPHRDSQARAAIKKHHMLNVVCL